MFYQKIIFIFLSLLTANCFGWGARGHDTICEAAVFLVQNPKLKEYLRDKPQMMGHLCNTPDLHWRLMGARENQLGFPTHYIKIDMLGKKVMEMPTSYKQIINEFTNQKKLTDKSSTIRSVPDEVGSNWWRADQFFRRSLLQVAAIKKATPPKNPQEVRSDDFPFNKIAFDWTVEIGIMGHFVADNAQPFHVFDDYDGYENGHGGIHEFYEHDLVALQDHYLQSDIVNAGLKMQSQLKQKKNLKELQFLTEKTVVEKMRALAALSYSEAKLVFAIDQLVTPSTYKVEKGMTLKTPAVRKSAEAVAKKAKPLIIQQMSRAAVLLAQLWDLSYEQMGDLDLPKYKSRKYPLTPAFVDPDYIQ